MTKDKVIELKDIFTPLFECVVVEFTIPDKTKGGLTLSKEIMKGIMEKQNPCMKIVAIGETVKSVKVGDWILPSPTFRPMQVPLIYKDGDKGTQHAQIHVSEILGIVDSDFAQIIPTETKEKIVN